MAFKFKAPLVEKMDTYESKHWDPGFPNLSNVPKAIKQA